MKLDLAKHLLKIEGVVVGALIGRLDRPNGTTKSDNSHQ